MAVARLRCNAESLEVFHIIDTIAQAGFLGWKCSLWPVPAWLEVQRSKYVFFLSLYDSINDMKYF